MGECFLVRRGGGADTSDATITPPKVLKDEIGYGADGKVIGTMPNKGAINHSLPINGSFGIPEGYHNGSGVVNQSIPTKSAQIYTPGTANIIIPSGQYLSGDQTILGEPTLLPVNVPEDMNFFGIQGIRAVGKKSATGKVSTTSSYFTGILRYHSSGSDTPPSVYYVTVTGLDFTPSCVIMYRASASYGDRVFATSLIPPTQTGEIHILLTVNNTPYGFKLDGTNFYMASGTFRLPVARTGSGQEFTWFAME